jgi:hypothetical protein
LVRNGFIHRSKQHHYSITLSARASSAGGTVQAEGFGGLEADDELKPRRCSTGKSVPQAQADVLAAPNFAPHGRPSATAAAYAALSSGARKRVGGIEHNSHLAETGDNFTQDFKPLAGGIGQLPR